jgi:predicted sulfurtransferase
MMEDLDAIWFCAGHGNVGVVKYVTKENEVKYYIGQCFGVDEKTDMNHILNWGSRFPANAGKLLFGDQ